MAPVVRAKVVGIDHLVLRVGDFARSKRFYDAVLGFLGFALKYEFDKTAGWSNGKTLFWIGEGRCARPQAALSHRRYRLPPLCLRAGAATGRRRSRRVPEEKEGARGRPAGRLSRVRRGLSRRLFPRPRRHEARRYVLSQAAQEAIEVSRRAGSRTARADPPCPRSRCRAPAAARRARPPAPCRPRARRTARSRAD